MTNTSAIGVAQQATPVGQHGIKRSLLGLALALFAVGLQAAQAPVDLRSTSRFAVLAGSGVSSVPFAAIKGDVGLSPAARSKITGLTPGEVTGSIFAADDGGAVAVMLTQAKADLTAAYNDAAGRSLGAVDVAGADLGGRTLAPGLYKSSGTLAVTGNLTLDAQGDSTAVFIFQMASSLNTASGSKVILIGGANAANIFWQVGSSATLGTTSSFKGTIMADQSVSLATGATLDGRAMARIGAVTMQGATVTAPATAITAVILESASLVRGPYANAAGQSVSQATKTVTVPLSGNQQFYRLVGASAVTISKIAISGNTVVITYL